MSKKRTFILKLSLTYRGNVNHQQSVHHPLFTLPVGIGNTLVAFKTNSVPGQTEGSRKVFVGVGKY